MKTFIVLFSLLGTAALAHAEAAPHLHEEDTVSLGMGLALIVAGLFLGWLSKDRIR